MSIILSGSKCHHSFCELQLFCMNIFAKNIFHLFYYRSDGVFQGVSQGVLIKVHQYTSPVTSPVVIPLVVSITVRSCPRRRRTVRSSLVGDPQSRNFAMRMQLQGQLYATVRAPLHHARVHQSQTPLSPQSRRRPGFTRGNPTLRLL